MKAINKNYDNLLPIFGIGVVAATYYLLATSKKKDETPTEDFENISNGSITPTVKPAAKPNEDLVLQIGSRGLEVGKLQSYMGITPDQSFGPLTEAKLLKLKGVKRISLKQYLNSPTINQLIIKSGSNVMAKSKTGTKIYDAQAKADTSYFSNHKVVKTIPYGQKVGTIRSANPAGNWYAVYYDALFGDKVGFVLASEIEKY